MLALENISCLQRDSAKKHRTTHFVLTLSESQKKIPPSKTFGRTLRIFSLSKKFLSERKKKSVRRDF